MKASIGERIQAALRQESLDGWLFDSFCGSDPIAENVLHVDHARTATRRRSFFVPAIDEPIRRVHAIDSELLEALPGKKKVGLPWQRLRPRLYRTITGSRRIAMQYCSLPSAIPNISRVDAGTVELVRSFGVDVVSSARVTGQPIQTHVTPILSL
jgi:Xaa-Pro aminopeptidase